MWFGGDTMNLFQNEVRLFMIFDILDKVGIC